MQLAAVIILCFSGLYILWFIPYAILMMPSSLIGSETITFFTPLLTYFSQIGILSFIDTFGAFFGPIFGVMICDFYLINKGNLINKDIYSLERNSAYYYSSGWHLKGVYSIIIGFIFSASTIWNSNLMFLQSFSWIIGLIISFVVYYLLAKD